MFNSIFRDICEVVKTCPGGDREIGSFDKKSSQGSINIRVAYAADRHPGEYVRFVCVCGLRESVRFVRPAGLVSCGWELCQTDSTCFCPDKSMQAKR